MFDATGALVNCQLIAADGTKRFLKGGRKRGCYHVIGEPDYDPPGLCIGEGFATMATVHKYAGGNGSRRL
jgi:putative DNA primase/helicase